MPAVRHVDRQLGTLAALVNNAGILEPQMRVEHDGRRSAGARLRDQRRGRVPVRARSGPAHVDADMAARRRDRQRLVRRDAAWLAGEYVDYAASKGAIDTMTIGLAREVAEEGIRVNAVRAGLHLHRDARQRRRTEPRRSGEGVRADEARRPAGRGRRRDPWLLSDEASYHDRHVHRRCGWKIVRPRWRLRTGKQAAALSSGLPLDA